ncbi:trypsin-like serine peptidase [Marimonas arenosa]|nr:serine protease [Marimonas arenosa]
MLALVASSLAAQDAPVLEAFVDGQVEARDIRIDAQVRSDGDGVLWTDEISVAGSDYIRLLLRVEGPAFPPGARLLLVGALGQQAEIALETIGAEGLWTQLMPFGRVRMALIADAAVAVESVLVIDSIAMQSSKVTPYSVYGENQLTPINAAAVPENLRGLGAPVAFLSFIQGGFARTCSGFLIGPDLLLTNEHCINNAETCRTMTAVFGFEFDAGGQLQIGPQVGCKQVEERFLNVALDASVVKLDRAPGPDFGQISVAANAASVATPMVIVQHPGSQPKQISILDCAAGEIRVDGRAQATDFTHTCDTAGGSSGAPVFDAHGALVGLHHFGFQDGEAWETNRAVHADLIAAWLETLGADAPQQGNSASDTTGADQ